MKNAIVILARDPTVIAFADPVEIVVAEAASAPLPTEIVWMPIGEHAISAGTPGGRTWQGKVRVTEAGARAAQASFQRSVAAGRKPWIDFNHADADAAAWVKGFSWDPTRGIIASLEWTPEGESALRNKRFRSFSPAFTLDRESGQVSGTYEGHAAGGLVNAPAFGAAMPALIAARLAGAESANTASGGSPDSQTKKLMNREQLIALLASLGIQHAPEATEQQLVELVIAYKPKPPAQADKADPVIPTDEIAALKKQVETIQASAKDAKARAAKAHVAAAVGRGALKKEDAAVQAYWQAQLEANEDVALAALNAIPGEAKDDKAVIVATNAQAGSGIAVKANPIEVLKAMHAEKGARKRGEIYRDFRPVIVASENAGTDTVIPILAANSLGTLTSDLIVLRALDLLKLKFPALTAITTDFSSENADYGQTVKTRIITPPAVGTYNTGTGYSAGNATTADVSIVINQHKYTQLTFNANEAASTKRNLFGEQVEAMHYALGKDLCDALYALFVIATYVNATTVATNSITRVTLPIAVAKAMNDRGVPGARRSLLLNSAAFAKLAEDPAIVSLATFQRPELITEYALPKVAGLQPIEAINLPGTGNMTGFALTPDAAAIATRLPNDYTQILPGVSHGSVSTVVNPDTGFAVLKTDYVNHDLGTANSRIAWMYGVAPALVASAQLVKSS